MDKTEKQKGFCESLKKVVFWSVIAFGITAIGLVIVTLLLTYTNISENIINVAIITISALSILIGSIIGALNIKKNGIFNGALVGLIYILTIYLLSSILVTGFEINAQAIIMMVCTILAGMVGGIVGVNFHKWHYRLKRKGYRNESTKKVKSDINYTNNCIN